MSSPRQGDLFGTDQYDLFDEDAPTPVYRADPDEVRAELYRILAEARAALGLPPTLPCSVTLQPLFEPDGDEHHANRGADSDEWPDQCKRFEAHSR